MRTVEIDDEVFAYLQSQAISYIETTPNQTLRRLFSLDKKTRASQNPPPIREPVTEKRKKQRRTNLELLVEAGLLHGSQKLYLHDYQGNRLHGYEAVVYGKSLKSNGKIASMSPLAQEFLQQEGYSSSSVRGPAHWYTEDGISIKDLWGQYLNAR